jgi:hypothetical protein
MPDRVEKLQHCIAHFECLLRQGASAEMIRVYLAELAAARAQLAEAERTAPKDGGSPR